VRLLLVHRDFPPGGGGAEVYTEAVARRLAREHAVTVLHHSAEVVRPDYDLRETSRDGLRVISCNNLHRKSGGFEAYRDVRAAAVVGEQIEKLRPDLVHVGSLDGLSTGLVFEARKRDCPVVITLHDFWPVCPLGQLLDLGLAVCPGPTPRRCLDCVGEQVVSRRASARRIGRRLPRLEPLARWLSRTSSSGATRIEARLREMRELLRAADVLVSPSRFLKQRLAKLGVEGIEVLPYGHEVLARPPRRPDPSGKIRFGFVGTAIPSKGLHVLAEAFQLLDDPRAALRVHGGFAPYHGDSTYETRVRAILGEKADEVLQGGFRHELLGEILAGLDVLVVPSLWEENAPLVVEEAFLAGLPVVVSDHGGLAERVRDGTCGLRFPPGDVAALARALRRFLEEPELRARLASNAPPVTPLEEHVTALEGLYAEARRRYRGRAGRIGVVVLNHGCPEETTRAVRSARDPSLDVNVLVVENGSGPGIDPEAGVEVLRLASNKGFAGGMNAGLERLTQHGCDRFLLLNNDACLEPGCLRRLAEALEDPELAAVGPVILREADGRIESRGVRFDPRWGRHRLLGHGIRPGLEDGRLDVESLSGAVLMLSRAALERVGPLDETYFLGFEDSDWCARARQAGQRLAVVLGARARHVGGHTLGVGSPIRLYYAARNHVRAAERLLPLPGPRRWLRRGVIFTLNLGHALRQRRVPRAAAVRAVLAGTVDAWRGRCGPAGETP